MYKYWYIKKWNVHLKMYFYNRHNVISHIVDKLYVELSHSSKIHNAYNNQLNWSFKLNITFFLSIKLY